MGWVFLASLEKLVLHEKKKSHPLNFICLADLLNLGEHAQGWVLFFGGKPHLKIEQKTLRPGVFPEETLELKFDALHLQLLLLPNLTATGKYGIWKITEKNTL